MNFVLIQNVNDEPVYAIELEGAIERAKLNGASINWGAVIMDALALFAAISAKDPMAIAAALAKLMHDLGFAANSEEGQTIARALASHFQDG